MKKIIISFFLFGLTCIIQAQQIYPLKESYDQLLEPYYTLPGSAYDYNNTSTAWWETWGWNLLSYLKMYEATHDKAYLNKFIKHSYGLQLRRGSSNIWNSPMNDVDATIVLYTGLLLRPMAEFVYIIKNDNSINNINLVSGLVPSVIGSQTILGYRDYANWLQGRVVESLDYMNQNYWINDYKCYSKSKLSNCQRNCADNNCSGLPCTFCNCPNPIEINFNSSYSASMFFIGSIDPINHSDYTYKAEQIVTYFRNKVAGYTNSQNLTSYTWFHDGVGQTNREDVSHGGIDIQIPLVAYKLYGNGLYQPSEMNNFAHTFTYNIWDRYNQVFHNNVFGLDGDLPDASIPPFPSAVCYQSPNGIPSFYGLGEVLTWMPLYTFDDNDDAPNDIYTVLVNQAANLLNDYTTHNSIVPSMYWNCNSSTRYLPGPQAFYGLSEVVKAQWDKECVNLTLYNRDVIYDQDFNVKNKLMVAPEQVDNFHQLNGNSFADPITTNNTFLVGSGTTVNMVAGESIELLPGFVAMEGSNFSASINPSACTDGRMYTGNANGGNGNLSSIIPMDASIKASGQKDKVKNEAPASLTMANSIRIYPNPTTGIFKITITKNKKAISVKELKVLDMLGKVIWQTGASTNNVFEVDITNYAQGIYYVRSINEDGEIEVQKLIKQ